MLLLAEGNNDRIYRAALILVLSLAGCTQTNAIECGDVLCPATSTCLSPERGCFPADQVEACLERVDGDGCSVAEVAGTCRDGLCVTESCGDGVLDELTEACDDGNAADGDSCSSDCQTASCLVPISHATVAEIVADERCPIAHISAGRYLETLTLERDIDIKRVGSGEVILDGGQTGTTLVIPSGVRARLAGFQITGGVTDACGGGILNEGDLVLEDMQINGNEAVDGGGICHLGGTLVSLGVEVDENTATSDKALVRGGGLFATALTVISGRTRFTNNVARSIDRQARGGGIFVEGTTAAITGDCELRGNQTVSTFGGSSYGRGAFGGAGYAISTALSISGCLIAENSAASESGNAGGGGLLVHGGSTSLTEDVRVEDNTVTGDDTAGGGLHLSATPTTAADVVISGNSVSGGTARGGGVYFSRSNALGVVGFQVTRASVERNSLTAVTTASGGGLSVDSSSTIALTEVSIRTNSAEGVVGDGGGIAAVAIASGDITLTVRRSVIANNRSTSKGGGLHLGSTRNAVNTRLVNTTISGNESNIGGGIFQDSDSTTSLIRIYNSTIASNTALTDGGGLRIITGLTGQVTGAIENTILSDNAAETGADCNTSGDFGLATRFSITGETIGCPFVIGIGNRIDTDPMLGPLGDNGGPTATHALLPGSPAIEGGDPLGCADPSPLTVDQRGLPRPVGVCDVGAFEMQ